MVRRSGARLAWLDAVRGFAALCVVFDHATYHVLEPARNWLYQWFDPGQYGVFVFFEKPMQRAGRWVAARTSG